MLQFFLRNWWLIALRGVFAILFGIAAIVWPELTLFVLVILFGTFSLTDGILTIVSGVANRINRQWWIWLFQGVISLLVGLLAFVWPGITALILLYLIAAWAVVTGVFGVFAAINLRKEIKGEWVLGLSGVLSILFGLLLVLNPGSGALALILVIGSYSIVFGLLLLYLRIKLRAVSRKLGLHDAQTVPGNT